MISNLVQMLYVSSSTENFHFVRVRERRGRHGQFFFKFGWNKKKKKICNLYVCDEL